MREHLAPFLGGLTVGVAIGMLLLSGFAAQAATGYPLIFTVGIAVMTFVGGVLLGRRAAPKTKEVRLTGRVFEFPQGPVMVEVALKRAKSMLPTKVTSSD